MGGKSLIEKGGKKISLNIWYEERTQLAILLLGDQAIVVGFFYNSSGLSESRATCPESLNNLCPYLFQWEQTGGQHGFPVDCSL